MEVSGSLNVFQELSRFRPRSVRHGHVALCRCHVLFQRQNVLVVEFLIESQDTLGSVMLALGLRALLEARRAARVMFARDVWRTDLVSTFLLRGPVPSCQVAVRPCTLQKTAYTDKGTMCRLCF